MSVFMNRLNRLRNELNKQVCQAILIENPLDIFYLTKQHLSTGKMLITKNDAILLVDGRYYETCKKSASCTVLLTPEITLLGLLQQHADITTLAFDSDHTSYRNFLDLEKLTAELKHSCKLIPMSSPIKKLREIKDEEEIATLRNAAELGSQGFDHVCSLLKEGISEEELAFELELFWRKRGGRGLAFDPIIAFGPNSSMPHYRAGSTHLTKGQCVLIDIGVIYQDYHSDMTRVVFFGDPDPKVLEIYEIVLKAQLEALQHCRAGVRVGDLDEAARSIIGNYGYRDKFTHSLGHGIGLEIHEYPLLRNKPPEQDCILEAGMVVTIEPGIYLPDIGGVRIEDTVVITADGYEDLTQRPKEIKIIL